MRMQYTKPGHRSQTDSTRLRRLTAGLILGVFFFMLIGCMPNAKAPILARHYALEYAPPAFGNDQPVNESVRLENFSVVRTYQNSGMVYRSGPYQYSQDAYQRWRVKPADMVSDLLLRDLRRAGLFRGVFSSWDSEDAGYVLSGTIEELYEVEESTGSKAVLGINVTLTDQNAKGSRPRILFQKNYRAVRDMDDKNGGAAMARAASQAMETVSREIITDTYQAIKKKGE